MNKPIFKKVTEPIYGSTTYVSYNQTDKQFLKSLDKIKFEYDKEDFSKDLIIGEDKDYKGVTLRRGITSVIRLLDSDLNTVVHEVFHVVEGILDTVGIEHNSHTSEAYAYLLGYLTKEIYINENEN